MDMLMRKLYIGKAESDWAASEEQEWEIKWNFNKLITVSLNLFWKFEDFFTMLQMIFGEIK